MSENGTFRTLKRILLVIGLSVRIVSFFNKIFEEVRDLRFSKFYELEEWICINSDYGNRFGGVKGS